MCRNSCLYRSPLWCTNFALVFNNDIRGGNKLLQTPTKEESGMATTAGPTTSFSKTLGIFFLFLLLILECITHTSLCAFVFLLINRIVYRCCYLSVQQGLCCVCCLSEAPISSSVQNDIASSFEKSSSLFGALKEKSLWGKSEILNFSPEC